MPAAIRIAYAGRTAIQTLRDGQQAPGEPHRSAG